MGVTQPARFGEDWSDERVRGYLERQPPAGENADFHVLMTAYKHMRAHDFERFIGFFRDAGRDLDARGTAGRTLLEIVRDHAKAADFVKILEAARNG
ncbi:MAG: PA4642 family protein [Pseudomonadota bacterium]